jgi:hypothetical protein
MLARTRHHHPWRGSPALARHVHTCDPCMRAATTTSPVVAAACAHEPYSSHTRTSLHFRAQSQVHDSQCASSFIPPPANCITHSHQHPSRTTQPDTRNTRIGRHNSSSFRDDLNGTSPLQPTPRTQVPGDTTTHPTNGYPSPRATASPIWYLMAPPHALTALPPAVIPPTLIDR